MSLYVTQVKGDRVWFAAEGGRTMFEVSTGKDGKSIDVRAVEATKVDGVIYEATLTVAPRSSNAVVISVQRYE